MHDGLTPRGGDDAVRGRQTPADLPASPPADREVPLPPGAEFAALHAWLDGEVEDMAVSTAAAARQREVWRRINEDAARMRRMSPPPFLEQRVMAAIAAQTTTSTVAAAPVEAPTAPRVSISWPIAAAAAATCAVLGAAIALLLG
jgi:hypothetical protein